MRNSLGRRILLTMLFVILLCFGIVMCAAAEGEQCPVCGENSGEYVAYGTKCRFQCTSCGWYEDSRHHKYCDSSNQVCYRCGATEGEFYIVHAVCEAVRINEYVCARSCLKCSDYISEMNHATYCWVNDGVCYACGSSDVILRLIHDWSLPDWGRCDRCGAVNPDKCNHDDYTPVYVPLANPENSYIPNNDGATHIHVELTHEKRCGNCNELFELAGMAYINVPCTFENGVCTLCGGAQTACSHEDCTDVYDDQSGRPVIFSNKTETHHDYQNPYICTCNGCGRVEEIYSDPVTEEHTYVNGVCACGAPEPECQHEFGVATWAGHSSVADKIAANGLSIPNTVLVSKTETDHTYSHPYFHECDLCGYGEIIMSEATEEHTYTDGACVCGAQEPECPHANTDKVADDSADPVYSDIQDATHKVAYGYIVVCLDCGEPTGETGYFSPEVQDHDFTNKNTCPCGEKKVPEGELVEGEYCPECLSTNYDDIYDDKPHSYRQNPDGKTHNSYYTTNRTCLDCGEVFLKGLEVLEEENVVHSFSVTPNWKYDEEYHWGEKTRKCAYCGFVGYTDEIPKAEHIDNDGDGKCDQCDEIVDEARVAANKYLELLLSMPEDKLLDNDSFVAAATEVLSNDMSEEKAADILACVSEAPYPYRELYLYSMLRYDVYAGEDVERAFFQNANETLEVGGQTFKILEISPDAKLNTLQLPIDFDTSTYFHESGHAIDYNSAEEYEYLSNLTNSIDLEFRKDLKNYLKDYLRENHPLVTEIEIINLVDYIVGPSGGVSELVSYDLDKKTVELDIASIPPEADVATWIMYETFIDEISEQLIFLEYDYMQEHDNQDLGYPDLIDGLTNNKIRACVSHARTDTVVVHGVEEDFADYWYKDGQPTEMVALEAWANYFEAVMTGNEVALDGFREYFPNGVKELDKLAEKLLKAYKASAQEMSKNK